VLLVRDLVAAANYYRDAFGFTYNRLWGEPPDFVILRRGGLHLMLSLAPRSSTIVPHWQVNKGMWNVYFWVDDVDALFAEFKGKGAKIDYGLEDKPYQVREFGVQDLDGYDIAFGQIIGAAPLKARREIPAADNQILVEADPGRNIVRLTCVGDISVEEMQRAEHTIAAAIASTRTGFYLLTDLSRLRSMHVHCMPFVMRTMERARDHGVTRVVRNIPDPTKDIGFSIMSLFHYPHGLQIITCENDAEADRAHQ